MFAMRERNVDATHSSGEQPDALAAACIMDRISGLAAAARLSSLFEQASIASVPHDRGNTVRA
jgi:hypothetical protein